MSCFDVIVQNLASSGGTCRACRSEFHAEDDRCGSGFVPMLLLQVSVATPTTLEALIAHFREGEVSVHHCAAADFEQVHIVVVDPV